MNNIVFFNKHKLYNKFWEGRRERERERKYSRREYESEKSKKIYCGEGERASFVREFPGFARSSF
jgi:hypothetical protein